MCVCVCVFVCVCVCVFYQLQIEADHLFLFNNAQETTGYKICLNYCGITFENHHIFYYTTAVVGIQHRGKYVAETKTKTLSQ